MAQEVYDAIVIGTGFGGTVATLALSQEGKKTLVLERGTFWMTPETLGMPTKPGNPTRDWAEGKNVRVQYWPRPDHALESLTFSLIVVTAETPMVSMITESFDALISLPRAASVEAR